MAIFSTKASFERSLLSLLNIQYLIIASLSLAIPSHVECHRGRPQGFHERSEEESLEDLSDRLTYSFWRGILNKNKKKLTSMISNQFVGKILFLEFEKERFLEEFLKRDIDEFSLKEKNVFMREKKLIIIYYIEMEGGMPSGRVTSEWRQEKEEWKLFSTEFQPKDDVHLEKWLKELL